ncbi:MAG: hypothetical protein P4L53_18095 [Candidatus Obscuribacterales bacterium]|nr:hypothetical protein [Candidatus Obscuribacterales bacterium]
MKTKVKVLGLTTFLMLGLAGVAHAKNEDLVIEKGAKKVFDLRKGPVVVHGKLVNHGAISFIGADKTSSAQIIAGQIQNDGSITFDGNTLSLSSTQKESLGIDSKNGTVSAKQTINVSAPGGLNIKGGNWKSNKLRLSSDQTVSADAESITGDVEVNAAAVHMGVSHGNLKIAKQDVSGDPLYYSYDGDISVPDFTSTSGEDLIVYAHGNVTAGNINTAGDVELGGGVTFSVPVPPANSSGSGMISDAECVAQDGAICRLISGTNGYVGSASVQAGSITANDLVIESSGTVHVTGAISVIDEMTSTAKGDQNFDGAIAITGPIAGDVAISGVSNGDGTSTAGAVTINGAITGTAASAVEVVNVPSTSAITIGGDITIAGGTVLIGAGGDFSGQNIDVSGGAGGFGQSSISISTNYSGGSDTFHVGSSSGNGVLSLYTDLSSGGGAGQIVAQSSNFWEYQVVHQYVSVTNLGSGGISVDDPSVITVWNSGGPAGAILLNAGTGDLTIDAGDLFAGGSGTNAPGQIALQANRIFTNGGVTIDASEDQSSGSTNHFVLIATSQLTYSGGLSIYGSGNGTTDIPAGILISPENSAGLTVNVPGVASITHDIGLGSTPVAIQAADGSALNGYAYGNNMQITLEGLPVSFTGGTVDLAAEGNTNQLTITYAGAIAGNTTLDFGSANVTLDTINTTGSGTNNINITADAIATQTGFVQVLNWGDTGANGGTTTVNVNSGDMSFGSSGAAYQFINTGGDASNVGNGGVLSISDTLGAFHFSSTMDGFSIDAESVGSSGNGGNVTLTAASMDDAGSGAVIVANGFGTGEGGNLAFTTTTGNINGLPGLDVSASGSSGSGGTISVQAAASTSIITLQNTTFLANSATTGDGGTISFSADQILIPGTTFEASGQDTGTGGEIDLILTGDDNQVVDLATSTITATGGPSGEGGLFSVTDVLSLTDPDSIINVAAEKGDSEGGSPASKPRVAPRQSQPHGDGLLIFMKHGIRCQYYKSAGYPAWPRGYFNCAHPGAPTDVDAGPLAGAELIPPDGAMRLIDADIWVWQSYAQYQTGTKDTDPDVGDVGKTVNPIGTTIYIHVFENPSVLPSEINASQSEEAAVHEFGHAFDGLQFNESGSTPYNTYVSQDYLNLDYDFVGPTAQLSHRRPPCETSTIDGKPGPFAGVTDQVTSLPYCDAFGTVLVNPNYLDSTNSNQPFRNSWILRQSTPYFTGANPSGWGEVYAQSMAFSVYVSTLTDRNQYFAYTFDGVLAQGQFACVRWWASAIAQGESAPTAHLNCDTATTWYPTLLGKKDSAD